MQQERLLPQDIEAEESVLGSLLIDSGAIGKVYFLKPEDFAREKHRWCFESCIDLFSRGISLDQRTLASELARRGRLDLVGGDAFLSHLVQVVPTSVHVEHYATLVRRASVLRRLIEAAHEIERRVYDDSPAEAEQALKQAEDILYKLRLGDSQRDLVPLREVFERYYKGSPGAEAPAEERLPSVPTGFIDLDKLLGSLQRSDMIVLAARPSLGKSSLALTIAKSAALHYDARVALFSLEMGKEQIADRLIAMHAGIDTHRLRTGPLSDQEQERVDQAIGELSEMHFWIDDSPVLRPVELRSKARRLALEVGGLDLVIIDYMQLMTGSTTRGDNRVQELSEISRAIKELARNINVPILALSQLSRAPEMRSPHIPQLSDLRDSGSIEQDADVVMFIYREDQEYDEERWVRLFPDRPYPRNIAQIRVAKHRHGPLGVVKLRFNSHLATFQDLAEWMEE
jgi:replicative DNA helicase